MLKSLSELTVSELKRLLVISGLAVTGRKADLVKRLLDAGHVGEVWCLDLLPAEILVKVMGFLPLPSLLSLASTCTRLHRFLDDPSLWCTIVLDPIPSRVGDHQESYRNMLENRGKHARKMIFKYKGYLGGPPLKSAMEVCGSNLTSLTVGYISIDELGMVADSCRVLTYLSVGHFLFRRTRWSCEDLSDNWKPSVAVAKKFKHLEHFAGDFDWRRVGMSMKTVLFFLKALIRSNTSLKRLLIGGVNLRRLDGWATQTPQAGKMGITLQRLAKKRGVVIEKR